MKQISPQAWISDSGRCLVLKLVNPQRVLGALPEGACRVKCCGDHTLVAMPYSSDSVKILRNIGIDTAGMEHIRHAYPRPLIEQKHKLAAHQITQAAVLTDNPRSFCTSTMRTGKTASVIFGARYLQEVCGETAVLVIATVSNLKGVWEKEILGMYPNATVNTLHGSKAARLEMLRRDADFYIINYDGIKLIKEELAQAVESGRITICIVDELTHYANSRSDLWAVADWVINGTRFEIIEGGTRVGLDGQTKKLKDRKRKLPSVKGVRYCWGLTGTPGGPDMVYGQVKMVNPANMPCLYTSWRDRTMTKVGFKYIPKTGYLDQIYQVMQPCVRFDKKDIMDLPPVVFSGRECELSKQQAKAYSQIRKEMMTMVNDRAVTAVSKSALVSKLLQIAAGVVISEDGAIDLDMTPRMKLLQEIIESATQKVVIFCAFTAVIDRVEKELTKLGHSVGVVDGRVSKTKRENIFDGFQSGDDYDVIICHPRTTAFGVELAAADTMVFFGPPLSGEFIYQQAIERMSSLKQKAESCQLIHLSSTSEERRLFRNIQAGVSINETINDMFTIK